MSEESRREPHGSELPGHDPAAVHPSSGGAIAPSHVTVGSHAEHGHDAVPLGPLDIVAWGAGLIGLGVGVVIALAFAAATGAL